MNEPVSERLVRLYEDSKTAGTCKSPQCGAAIDYYETFPRHKQMPMNKDAVPRRSMTDPDTNRVVGFYAASDSHFSSCVDAERYRS